MFMCVCVCANCLYYTYRHYTAKFVIQSYYLPSCRCFLNRAHVFTVMGGWGAGREKKCVTALFLV